MKKVLVLALLFWILFLFLVIVTAWARGHDQKMTRPLDATQEQWRSIQKEEK